MRAYTYVRNGHPLCWALTADVGLPLRINSPRRTSSSDVSVSIEHEYVPQPDSLPDNPLLQDLLMTTTSAHHKSQNYNVVSALIIAINHCIWTPRNFVSEP